MKSVITFKRSIVLFFCIGLFVLICYLIQSSYIYAGRNGITLQVLSNLIFATDIPLSMDNGRIHMLIMGMGGGQHEGFDLTDTMIFLSLDPKNSTASAVSIPRDIWMSSQQERINTAYHRGGLKQAKVEVEEVLGQRVHYAWLVDFSGFTQIINFVGGIDVNVESSFDDKEYPVSGKEQDLCGGDPEFRCRYEQIHFEKGLQHMDGETALKYVRSRHAEGDEGNDFARSKRQQIVMAALKEKLTNPQIWKNIGVMRRLLTVLQNSIKTDMTLGEAAVFAKSFKSVDSHHIKNIVLNTDEELLVTPPLTKYNGAWVLEPKDGTFEELHAYVHCQLTSICISKR